MTRKINWGIIGLGNIAHLFASDLMLSERSTLRGVASRDLEKATEFGDQYHSVKCYGSYEELADDPEVDVVYIATPHTFHCEQTLMCLEKGKAVLCEKPMGIRSAETEKMAEAARSRNLFLMEGMWTRFIPATIKMLELLKSNTIGELLFIHADFGFKSDASPDSRLYKRSLGGGSLLDIGVYPVYLSMLTLGLPAEIKATARMTDTKVDSYCSMLLNYDNDAKAVLESTFETETPTEAVLYGSRGTLTLHSRFHHSERITVKVGENVQQYDIPYMGNGYYHEIEEVNQCLIHQNTESDKLSLQTSLNLIKIIDNIKEEIGLTYS
ncbi:MAG: Gfo/Idh/MocA family oxidoreductase [Balneolaceae bacterium]|nr:Gfo/Idh/MocA family oxidoreductase [Balneolaceae bacterium]